MGYRKAVLLTGAALVASIAFFELTDVDIQIQDHFYDTGAARWILEKSDALPRLLLYTGAKGAIIALGVACGVGVALSYRWARLRSARRPMAVMAFSLIFVPLTISGIKNVSGVYTPRQIQRYGGEYPYVRLLERYPEGVPRHKRGKGFPAGHASGGLALMASYFAFRRRAWRIAGLLAGLAIGWIMGAYQLLAGQHYLSHQVVSTFLAWMIILTINRLLPADKLPADAAPQPVPADGAGPPA